MDDEEAICTVCGEGTNEPTYAWEPDEAPVCGVCEERLGLTPPPTLFLGNGIVVTMRQG